MQRQRRRAVVIAARVCGIALVCVVSLLLADRTGLYCLSTVPKGSPTATDGPIAVRTDASAYTPNTPVTITATNRIGVPIYLYPTLVEWESLCGGYEMQHRVGAEWQSADVVGCGGDTTKFGYNGVAELLAPDQSSTTVMDISRASLPPGTYRYILRYVPQSTVPPNAKFGPLAFWQNATPVASQPFRVCICARCT